MTYAPTMPPGSNGTYGLDLGNLYGNHFLYSAYRSRDFTGSPTLSAPWLAINTSSGGTATVRRRNGHVQLLADVTKNEAQDIGMTWNDALGFQATKGVVMKALIEIPYGTAFQDAAEQVFIGVGNTYNAAWDSISRRAHFTIVGDASAGAKLYYETDDNTTDSGEIDTGIVLYPSGSTEALRRIYLLEIWCSAQPYLSTVSFRVGQPGIFDTTLATPAYKPRSSVEHFATSASMAAVASTDYYQPIIVARTDDADRASSVTSILVHDVAIGALSASI